MVELGKVVVTARDIHKWFGNAHVLRGVDLDVREHETVGIIGRSGSGKTTLLRCLNFMEEATVGRVKAADRVPFIEDGVIAEEGPPEQILDHPQDERTRQFLRRFLTHDKIAHSQSGPSSGVAPTAPATLPGVSAADPHTIGG